jgi:hypothetical protein
VSPRLRSARSDRGALPAGGAKGPGDPGPRPLAELVDAVVHPAQPGVRGRASALAALVPALGVSAKSAGTRAVVAGQWLSDIVSEIAPHVTVRNAGELRRQFPGQSDDEIAEHLVVVASRTTAAIGAAAGALAAAEFVTPPALLAAPIQLAAETVAVVSVELRLVAELHEINNLAVRGGPSVAGPAYLNSWVRRRAVTSVEGSGLGALLGGAAKRELRVRMLRRMGRSTTTLAPFLAGAAAGAEVNRRSTKDLGEKLRAEMRGLRRRADIVQ